MDIAANNNSFAKRIALILIIFFTVFFSTWQDFFLADSLGEIFKSPVIFVAPFFVVSEYFLQKVHGTYYSKISNIYLYFHILYVVITVAFLGIWLAGGNPVTFLGDNIFVKSIKQILYYSFFWGLFRFFYLMLTKADKYNVKTDRIFLLLVVIYIFILLWEAKTSPFALGLFHTVKAYTRIRLLTFEASGTGSVALLILSGLCLGKRNKLSITIGIAFIVIFVALSGSKMFLVGAALSILILNIKLIKRYKIAATLGFALVVVIFSYFVIPKLVDSLLYDIDNATSVTTRSVWYITSLRTLFIYPLGTGGLSANYFLRTLASSITMLTNVFPDLNFTEVLGLGTDSLKGVQAGSTFGNFVVLLGFPGLWLFIKLLRILVKAAKSNMVLGFFVIYFIITNFTTESMESKFTYAIFFAIIAYVADKKIKQTQVIKDENIVSVA